MRITYVTLQPRGAGTAADSHVDGMIGGLRRAGCRVRLYSVERSHASLGRRLLAACRIVGLAMLGLSQGDVLYVRMHPLALPAILWARIRGIPSTVEVNGVPEDFVVVHPQLRRVKWLLRFLLSRQLRAADHVFAVTPGLCAWVRDHVRRDIHVTIVPNAADPDRFRPGLLAPADVPPRYAIFFGALASWQGLAAVLAATREPGWPQDVALVVVGDGPLRATVERWAAESPDRIRYVGPIAPNDVPAYVANALSSLAVKDYHAPAAGQSPLKVYESLASGTPVVTSAMHGASTIATETCGMIVIEDVTPTAVADAVNRHATDRQWKRQAETNGRRLIVDGHTWDHRAAVVLRTLQELLGALRDERGRG